MYGVDLNFRLTKSSGLPQSLYSSLGLSRFSFAFQWRWSIFKFPMWHFTNEKREMRKKTLSIYLQNEKTEIAQRVNDSIPWIFNYSRVDHSTLLFLCLYEMAFFSLIQLLIFIFISIDVISMGAMWMKRDDKIIALRCD